MTRQDEIAAKAIRTSTLKSLKLKRKLRLKQLKSEYENKIREINIQYAEDPEFLKAKYAAEDYARSEKAKKRAEKQIAKEKNRINRIKKLRPYSIAEEIFSSIVQGIGACLFIAATVLLDVIALERVDSQYRNVYLTLYTCFGITMILNYISSILHHALTNASAKETFKRLTHCLVFLIIACAYTTYAWVPVLSNENFDLFGMIVLGIVWIICFVGFLMYAIAGSQLEIANIVFYAVLGWASLFLVNQLYHSLTVSSFSFLITSGVVFTLGLIFCSIRKVRFMHAIGNTIMLVGSVLFFFSFFLIF